MQKMPATTPVMKLMTGRTTAAMGPKNAWVTRIESAPVSGAVIRNEMHEEREAPLRRISATTGTTEQLQSGIGTPMAALEATDFRLSRRSHLQNGLPRDEDMDESGQEQAEEEHRRQQEERRPEEVEKPDQHVQDAALQAGRRGSHYRVKKI